MIAAVAHHLNNSAPVLGDFGKVEGFRQVDQIEDILLETRTTETLSKNKLHHMTQAHTYHRGFQKFGAHSRIFSDGKGDLINVGTGSLANGRKGIHGGDTLGQHGVGGELGQLGRPQTDCEDSVGWDPVGVDGHQSLASVETRFSLERTDQYTVGGEKILDGGTLGQEF